MTDILTYIRVVGSQPSVILLQFLLVTAVSELHHQRLLVTFAQHAYELRPRPTT